MVGICAIFACFVARPTPCWRFKLQADVLFCSQWRPPAHFRSPKPKTLQRELWTTCPHRQLPVMTRKSWKCWCCNYDLIMILQHCSDPIPVSWWFMVNLFCCCLSSPVPCSYTVINKGRRPVEFSSWSICFALFWMSSNMSAWFHFLCSKKLLKKEMSFSSKPTCCNDSAQFVWLARQVC